MAYRIVLYAPDRGISYDGHTPDHIGVGGGITARVSLLAAFAAAGHDVTAVVNCPAATTINGVRYVPLDQCREIDADAVIAISTGGALTLAPLRDVTVRARLRILWVQGVPQPADIDAFAPDFVYAASNFLRDVCVERWGIAPTRMFVCYNGIDQARFAAAASQPTPRDPFAIAYIGPPEKGLDASLQILRRLRDRDDRYHLDVFGGPQLWGRDAGESTDEPGVRVQGLCGQAALMPKLFGYEYCLAPQAMEEGFGIGVQEAKRAGMIVLASAVGAFRELIRSSQDGFLIQEPHTSDAALDRFAGTILRLAQDPARRARIRANATRTPWSWHLAAQTWTAHWDHVLSRATATTTTSVDGTTWLELPDGRHTEATGDYCPSTYEYSPRLDRFGPTNRLLIAGYYGHRNIGDEAILHAMLEELRRAVPRVAVTVVSGDPAATRRDHDVDAVYERNWLGLIDAAERCDLIVLGGGGLLQDYHGVDPNTLLSRVHWGLTFFAAFPALATLMRRPFMLCGVGVGPLTSADGMKYTRLILERADAATVRDADSLHALQTRGAVTDHVRVTADPAFLIEAAAIERGRELLRRAGVPPTASCVIAVAVRHWEIGVGTDQWQASLAQTLDRLVDAHEAAIVFVPFQSSIEDDLTDDVAVAHEVCGRMRHSAAVAMCEPDLSPSEVQSVLAACTLVVAMRLHAVILGANAYVPVVALAYDPKVGATMRQLGMGDYLVGLGEATTDSLFQLLTTALAGRAQLQQQLRDALVPLRAAARQNTESVVELLSRRLTPSSTPSVAWTDVLRDALLARIQRAETMETHANGLTAHVRALEADLARRAPEPVATVRADASALELRRMLDERTTELSALGVQLRDAQALLARTPGYASRQRRRAVQLGARSAWRALVRVITAVARPVQWLVVLIARLLLPQSTRAALGRTLTRGLMNPQEYVFDTFKRQRIATYGCDLQTLRAPGEPGLVSIVLPAYNGARYIREAIDSILSQTYARFELIIVDDGSTDETLTIAETYATRDARVRVVAQDHRALPRTLSHGFRLARGTYLTWTSCDNRLKPEFLERMVGCLERHPDWDMAYANLDIIGEDGQALKNTTYYDPYQRPSRSEHIYLPTSTSELNTRANNSIGAPFLYRNRVAHLLGDYSPFRFVMEDYDYWMRVNALMTLRHADFDEPLYEYRFHSQSLTSRWAEFDMLGKREQMMVFEDFRRDFYLSPITWVIDGDGSSTASTLERCARDAGHVVFSGDYPLASIPDAGVPVVYVTVSDDPERAMPGRTDLPAGTVRALVTSAASLPVSVSDGWDTCWAVGHAGDVPRLSGDYRGWFAAADVETLFHAIDISAKSRHLERVEAETEAGAPPTLNASVVICTRGISDRLRQAVRSVAAQQVGHESYELILVDNNPQQRSLREAVAGMRDELFRDRPDRLRFVVCPAPGLSAARNAGIGAARGEIACFLDDDVVADPQWLRQLLDAFDAHPLTGVIGGHIALHTPEPRPRAVIAGWKRYWSEFVTDYTEYTEVADWRRFPWGANWSARRSTLRRIGGFRSRYGRVGANFWGGEELVAACLAQRLGDRIAVLPSATVAHDVDPSRFTVAHVRRTMGAGQMVGHLAARELYLPASGGLSAILTPLATHHFDASVKPLRYRWMDAWFRKRAQIRVLFAACGDVLRRARMPIVADRSTTGNHSAARPHQ